MNFRKQMSSLIFLFALAIGLVVPLAAQQVAAPDAVLELRLAEDETAEGLTEFEMKDGTKVYLHPRSIVRQGDIQSVKEVDSHGSLAVSIRLTRAGGKRMNAASKAYAGKKVAILYEGRVISAPMIQAEINRDVVINGNFSADQVKEMVTALQPIPRPPRFEKDAFDGLAKRLDRAHERKKFSGAVLIAVDGKIKFEKSVGFANIKEKQALQNNSSFRLASVSKQFAAMGIMLLKEDGKLEYDDPITKFLPALPYKDVTIRHLLHHTGGLADYVSVFRRKWDNEKPLAERKMAFNNDVVALFAEHQPKTKFKPGERFEYSNTGYVMLGSIIEKASGQTIHEFFDSRVFKPLEMKDSMTFRPDKSFNLTHRVYGFQYDHDGGFKDNDWNYLNGMVGDGGFYASARDMLKWDQALYGEKLVKQSTLEEAFTCGKLNDGSLTDYGFGWGVEASKHHGLSVSHSGAWVGFRTVIIRHPERKYTVIVLSNNSTTQLDQITDVIEEL